MMQLSEALTILDRLSLQQSGRRLQSLEREIVTIAWEDRRYRDVEKYEEQTVKNKALALWRYLTQLFDTKVKKSNLRQVVEDFSAHEISPALWTTNSCNIPRGRSNFYGRSIELRQLQYWIEVESSQCIFIHGAMGIGKTAIAQKIAENLSARLDYVVRISLQKAPPLLDVLSSIIKQLGGGRSAQLPRNISIAIDRTIGYLQKHRCLLILDDAEAVLNHDPRDSTHPSIQDYLQFIERVNLDQHRSCCLIILEQNFSSPDYSYRQLELDRLDWRSCQRILDNYELSGTQAEWELLVKKYHGNPRYLNIIAQTIESVFSGKIDNFLDLHNLTIYDGVQTMLLDRLECLSPAEIYVLNSISIEGGSIGLEQLKSKVSDTIKIDRLVTILDELMMTSLIEGAGDRYSLSKLISQSVRQYSNAGYY
jgi:DNA replication protein DnaC